tara:strand:+ start:138 stop:602 length:465 start_codon:yes stop_codon:yes gene_type:complete
MEYFILNPDFHDIHNTAEYTTWTLKDSEGNVVTFKVLNRVGKDHYVEVVENSKTKGASGKYLLVAARNMWDEYIRRGFRVQNKCVSHDMEKFYDAKRKVENNSDTDYDWTMPVRNHLKKDYDREKYALVDHRNPWKDYKKMLAKKAYSNYALDE